MTVTEMVREFHDTFGLPVRAEPTNPPRKEAVMRYDIQEEETHELGDAIDKRDVIGVADALADIVYVAYGTALSYGIDLDAVVAEVHRSNMSKLGEDGKPLKRKDGKVLKGPRYFTPDIAGVLS